VLADLSNATPCGQLLFKRAAGGYSGGPTGSNEESEAGYFPIPAFRGARWGCQRMPRKLAELFDPEPRSI